MCTRGQKFCGETIFYFRVGGGQVRLLCLFIFFISKFNNFYSNGNIYIYFKIIKDKEHLLEIIIIINNEKFGCGRFSKTNITMELQFFKLGDTRRKWENKTTEVCANFMFPTRKLCQPCLSFCSSQMMFLKPFMHQRFFT